MFPPYANEIDAARHTVYRLLDELAMSKGIAVADLYSELCCMQGRLEKLLEDVPTVIRVETDGNGNGDR